MAKPNSSDGYHFRWMELAIPIFESEGMDAKSGMIKDRDVWKRALLRTFRSFLVECYLDEQIEISEIRFAGMTRQAVLAILIVDEHSWSFRETYESNRELLETYLMHRLTHWKLPDLAFRIVWGQVNGLPDWQTFALPHCSEELRSHFER